MIVSSSAKMLKTYPLGLLWEWEIMWVSPTLQRCCINFWMNNKWVSKPSCRSRTEILNLGFLYQLRLMYAAITNDPKTYVLTTTFVVFAHMCLHSRNPEWKSGPNWDTTGLVAERTERCVTIPWLLKFPFISDIWIFLFTFNWLKDVSWSSLMMKTGKYNPPTGRGGKHLGTIIQPRVHNMCAQKILHIILD